MRRASETRDRLNRIASTAPNYRDVRIDHLEHLSASVHEFERRLAKAAPSLNLTANAA